MLAQVFSTGLEVVKDVLLVTMCACVMPLQPILATPPEDSQHISCMQQQARTVAVMLAALLSVRL